MTDIETIREGLRSATTHLPEDRQRIIKALAALSRVEERTLPELPDGYTIGFVGFNKQAGCWDCCLNGAQNIRIFGNDCHGSTPRAAVLNAISKIEG